MIRTFELTKKYPRNEALHGLTLEVPEGSVFALLGPNGAGKSTAIKIVMNIIQPTAGRAEVLGVDSRRLGPQQLSRDRVCVGEPATAGLDDGRRLPCILQAVLPGVERRDSGGAGEVLRPAARPAA